MRNTNKKGQVLEQFGMIALGIGTLAILLVVIFLINANVTTQTVDEITATSYTGVSIALPNATTTTVDGCIIDEAISVTSIRNNTGAGSVILGTANYTVALNTIAMSVTGVGYAGTANITYRCRLPSLAYNSTAQLNNDTYSLVGWVSLIVVLLIGIMILLLVRKIRQ